MRYDDEQLLLRYETAHAGPVPRGMSSFGVAVKALLDQFPKDAVSVVISDEGWYG